MPSVSGFDEDFTFESESATANLACDRHPHHGWRIDPEAGLGVSNGMARCPGNPEASEAIGPVTRQRKLTPVMKPRTDHDLCGVLQPRREQKGDVGGVVLTVSVKRHDATCVTFESKCKCRSQTLGLTSVCVMREDGDWKPCKLRNGAVGGAIVHDDHSRAQRQRTFHEPPDGARLLERGYGDPDSIPR